MQLYNTLTRTIEPIQADNDKSLGLYACGPTVYDHTHLGHLRKYIMDDVLVRALRQTGFSVTHVQNITDVGHLTSDGDTGEDKLEKGAKKQGLTAWQVAQQFEEFYWQSMEAVNVVRPDVSCRATDHIESQLQLVKTLEKKGFTYVIASDGVYFDTSLLDDYGKLSGQKREEKKAGARLDLVEGKRNPTDFAVWKFEREGENRAMVWPSPWAERSFPGWHIECSAMSMQYLGPQFTIHTGGIDHIPVHHTNEIAQSEAAMGKQPFVRYWVHHNFLQIEGEKMSKSLGNFFTVEDLEKRGIHPLAFRLLLLGSHYRSELNFTWENALGAQSAYMRLLRTVVELPAQSERTVLSQDKLEKVDRYREQFLAALHADLNTPQALATMWEVTKSNIPSGDKYDLLLFFDEVFGLKLSHAEEVLKEIDQLQKSQEPEITPEIQALLDKRATARANQDWQT
ncbi:cysteine--tRNA ligase, partial [Candidatus Woesebacteria bacterium]|nr:cysteine--tRNA ligase [Candidatus Woesebacteria bacterium]